MKNTNFERFISEISEDFERTWLHHPPVIELRGWWWKSMFHIRKMRDVMQRLIEEEWHHNYERIDNLWVNIDKEYGHSIFKEDNI